MVTIRCDKCKKKKPIIVIKLASHKGRTRGLSICKACYILLAGDMYLRGVIAPSWVEVFNRRKQRGLTKG